MKMNKNKKLYYIIGLVVILILAGIGLMLAMNNNDRMANVDDVDKAVAGEQVEEEQKEEKITKDDPLAKELKKEEKLAKKGMAKVSSMYCEMYYPIEWKDKVIVEDELNVVSFIVDFGDGKKTDLFDVVAVEDDNGKVEMHIVKFDLEFNGKWSEEDKTEAKQMQKDADFVAKYLKKDKFTVIME